MLSKTVEAVVGGGSAKEILEIDERLEELHKQLMKLVVAYDVAEQIHSLRNKKFELLSEESVHENGQRRTNELLEFINQQDSEIR